MTPRFSEAVDPVFQCVLELLEHIEQGEELAHEEIQDRIRGKLEQAEARLGQSEEWKLAKHALVCWIDDVLISAAWKGNAWWANNVLERHYFNKRNRAHDFYTWAIQASSSKDRDALEVYYLCVVLGFRGLYVDPVSAVSEAESLALPPQLPAWVEQTARAIRSRPMSPINPTGKMGPGAPPRRGQAVMLISLIAAAVLGGMTFVLFVFQSQ